jgi:hypothetical protein
MKNVISAFRDIVVPRSKAEIIDLVFGGDKTANTFNVEYDVNGKTVREVEIVRCKNAIVANFTEDYMRRRDPDCLYVGDNLPTDKLRFNDAFPKLNFETVRGETLEYLETTPLIAVPFLAGGEINGYPAVLIAPRNAAFFAYGTAMLQHFVNIDDYKKKFEDVKLVIYLAPPFRHTHFNKKQVVVFNRKSDICEMFAYNLYPGPSAKKGVYGFLIDIGEREGWVTNHASVVKLVTPYDNEIVIMHEGASGGGKSEMGEIVRREDDGKILIGTNTTTKERFYINLGETCEILPVADDMVTARKDLQNSSRKLVVADAEESWFYRTDGIREYGSHPALEKLCTHPAEPLLFLNITGHVGATALIWEHKVDSDGKPCPNPRVIFPRSAIKNIIDGAIEVDVRSFGVRMPPSSAQKPDYGILGMLHVLPPALAWLWRLVAPRGFNNPSIVTTNKIASEGVGSYWPFAAGQKVTQANLLLEQIIESPKTRYILMPNQHIGNYAVGFMPQWISREYIARRGGIKFKPEHLIPARLPILGFCLQSLKIDGQFIPKNLLQPELQSELGTAGYDKGAKILTDFFKKELKQFLTPALDPLGKKIIECFLNDGALGDFIDLIPMKY